MGFFSRFFSFIPKLFNIALVVGSNRAKAKVAEVDGLTEEERVLVEDALDAARGAIEFAEAEIKKAKDDS